MNSLSFALPLHGLFHGFVFAREGLIGIESSVPRAVRQKSLGVFDVFHPTRRKEGSLVSIFGGDLRVVSGSLGIVRAIPLLVYFGEAVAHMKRGYKVLSYVVIPLRVLRRFRYPPR